METFLPFHSSGTLNVFLYQPIPAGKYPPSPPVRFLGLISPSILQSCGKSKTRHFESSKLGCSALVTPSLVNRQPSSKDTERLEAVCARAIFVDDAATVKIMAII